MEISPSLRAWFTVHAVLDLLLGLPLLFVPEALLPRLGWSAVDPVTARLFAAALLAMGVGSWRMRRSGVLEYRLMLGLKVVWSSAAVLGLTMAIARGAPALTFLLLAISLLFCGVWSHHAIRLRQLANAPEDSPSDEPGGDEPVSTLQT